MQDVYCAEVENFFVLWCPILNYCRKNSPYNHNSRVILLPILCGKAVIL
ncbi:MAG: hypothetical protein ACTS8A_03945 [Arsenophonus sp. ET-LJ4-MAG3]